VPTIGSGQLVDAVLLAIQASSSSAVLLSSLRTQPHNFVVTTEDGEHFSLWVYVWTLTPGGRPNLPYEYRIQMTSVSSPLPINPHGYTILIGYEPNLQLFAGFDLERHHTFTTGSPSVQIDIRVVQAALQDGLAFDRKSNNEIAVGFRPDQFVSYAIEASTLHRLGKQRHTLSLLKQASAMQRISDAEINRLSEPRRRIIQRVSRLSRNASFRQQVLFAYDHRCAVTKAQLRLVDAAHVLPVGAPGSTDSVGNGIALTPTYHRAFDAGLIYLTEKFEMKINPAKEAQLRASNLAGGIGNFSAPLGPILLPPDHRQRPNTELIRKANKFRLIA
jgi:putative restriction endonuclease